MNLNQRKGLKTVNLKEKSTRARARALDTYELSATSPEVRKLAHSLEESDFAHFTKAARKLTPGGQRLLKSIMQMTMKRVSFGNEKLTVRPFTRAELGSFLTKGAPLCPHDIKLLGDMVKAGIVDVDREVLPAKRFTGVSGDELMKGAGWQYVYRLRPLAVLALLRANAKYRQDIDKMLKEPADERLPFTLEKQPWWKQW
jgi:hypothetical protein